MRKKMSHKLTFEQKKEIWKLYNEGYSPVDIAEKFGVTRLTIYTIGKNEKYKN